MNIRRLAPLSAFVLLFALLAPALAQFGDVQSAGARLGTQRTTLWKVGVVIRANGPCKGIYCTVPVPTDWPEQRVRVHKEEFSPSARKVRYRTLEGGVKQMIVQIPTLRGGEEARALVTYEVDRNILLPPKDTAQFVLAKSLPRGLRKYLAPSPLIEVRDRKIVTVAKQLRDPNLSGWKQVEAIYDFVRENVQYKNGKLKGAVAALRDGTGDCEELTSLFIAICRANDIPARTVWVPGHCYPEFYLVDVEGKGHWLPCQAAGSRDFGGIPEQRPILQKGDNFKVPKKRQRQRYVAEFLEVKTVKGGRPPSYQFVRELVAED